MLRRPLLPVLLVPMVVLAACGSDGQTDKAAITKIISEGGRDPVTICDHLSDRLLARFKTQATCKKAAKADKKNTDPNVMIDSLKIDGKKATANITGNDGKTTITFVKDDGSWKVYDTRQRVAGG